MNTISVTNSTRNLHQDHTDVNRPMSVEFRKILEVLITERENDMTGVMEHTKSEPMLQEFRQEAAITKRVLDRVPADKLSWKPHPKSMSLGQLSLHLAAVPGTVSGILRQDSFDASKANFQPQSPQSLSEVFATYEQSIRDAEQFFTEMTDQKAQANWRMTLGDKEILVQPRISVARSIILNHWYHHRGQLSVYLRLLDVPVPVIYGRSADESPFG
jgi:uncharacterized damage-inducible protein DinB